MQFPRCIRIVDVHLTLESDIATEEAKAYQAFHPSFSFVSTVIDVQVQGESELTGLGERVKWGCET